MNGWNNVPLWQAFMMKSWQCPMGYQTLVGDMGNVLSGGQKTKEFFIARALYRRPKILFLDEATSHLDVKKEYQINEMIKSLGITRVMIAHRPETIKSMIGY